MCRVQFTTLRIKILISITALLFCIEAGLDRENIISTASNVKGLAL